MTELDYLTNRSKILNVEDLASVVLKNPKFLKWTACGHPDGHHFGDGELLKHTYEVVQLCEATNNLYSAKKINIKHVFLAALFHDVGKIYDYQECAKVIATKNGPMTVYWESTQHKYQIHHIFRSACIWTDAARQHNYPEEEVLHAILAHHGRPEWGSPVEPQTKLAHLLHNCDSISARLDDSQ